MEVASERIHYLLVVEDCSMKHYLEWHQVFILKYVLASFLFVSDLYTFIIILS